MDLNALVIIEGLKGEEKLRKYFARHGIEHMQIDLIAYFHDKPVLIEIKHQEMFKAPPFDGHGLPRWQINARMKFYHKTSIHPYLFVIEKNTNICYFNSLVELENGNYYDTHGLKPRRIYELKSFKILNLEK